MLPNKEKRVCPHSKIEFIPKRSNQKFATKECRVAYHNDINNSIRKKMAYINKPLFKNYKVFSELLSGRNEGTFHSQFLIGKGVSFEVFTNLKKFKNNYVYAVFEFWYYKIDDFNFKIKRI